MEGNVKRFLQNELYVLFFIFAFLLFWLLVKQFFVVVPVGYTGVQERFGKVYDEELSSGFHAKSPFVRVTLFDIQTRTIQFTRYVSSEYVSGGSYKKTTTTVLYHLVEEKASDMYRDVGEGYEERVVFPYLEYNFNEEVVRKELEARGVEIEVLLH